MIKHVLRGNKTVLAVRGAIIPQKQFKALYGRIKGIETHENIRNNDNLRSGAECGNASPVGVYPARDF